MEAAILDFLKALKNNNNREWFQANKKQYETAKRLFEGFIDGLIPRIREMDPQIDMITARDCVFRIYRDVRFSHDKSPYKTNMGAYIARGGKGSAMAGYYVHVEPEGSFLAGGMYMPQPDVLKRIREEIYFQPSEFKKLIREKNFQLVFGEIDDPSKMKNPPKGYPKDFPDIDLLKFKSYAVMHKVDDQKLLEPDYTEYAVAVFTLLRPFNDFFNKIL